MYSYTDANGHDNGNVTSIVSGAPGRSQYFAYDSLNRLSSAVTGDANQPAWQGETGYLQRYWGESYGYDAWGNLLSIGVANSNYTGCTQENLNQSVNAQNQIVGDTYDAENHLVSTAGVNYAYDGDGKRVMKSAAGTGTIWYGLNSAPAMETDLNGGVIFDYI